MLRIGLGYDIHPLVEGRRLILGGLEIPSPRGLAGHSDGDGLIHAVIDALLGAAGEGDIGRLFPADPRTKGISSLALLRDVMDMLRGRGWRVVNVDAVVVAEEPRLAPYVEAMKKKLCSLLGVDEASLGIKGKTNEGLDAVGRGEAIACWAVALLER